MKAISHPVRPEPFDRLRTGSPRSGEEEDDSIEAVIAKMTTHNIIRVPVVRGGKLVGVIAWADILSRLIEPEFVTVFGGP
jgi:signal-transduction protein with cAMP-binding, CBS, and nucleotidyltransferase domain